MEQTLDSEARFSIHKQKQLLTLPIISFASDQTWSELAWLGWLDSACFGLIKKSQAEPLTNNCSSRLDVQAQLKLKN
jgi:hypothetical protein